MESLEISDGLFSGRYALFAVCDGHGGRAAAEFISSNLVEYLTKELVNPDCVKVEDALIRSYEALDKQFLQISTDLSGTTCVSALISYKTGILVE